MNYVTLGHMAEIQLGKMLSPNSKTGKSSFPYLRNQNVQWGRIDVSDLSRMDFSERERAKFELRKGDLLICEGGEPGRCAVWQGELANCYYQKALHRVRPYLGMADSEFLYLWIRHQALMGEFEDQNFKTTIAHLPLVRLEQLPVPALGIDEQRQMAARLKSQLAAVEEARQAAQAQLGELIRLKASAIEGVFSSLTDGQRIGDVARLQSGYAFKSQVFQKNGIRLLRNSNILPEIVYWDESVFLAPEDKDSYADYELNDGDILISLDRPIISSGIKVARVSSQDLPSLLVQRVGRFILNQSRVDADYLYLFLQSARFISAISGHDQSLGVPHISPKQVEGVVMPCPDLIEQKRIAGLLADILCVVRDGVHAAEKQINEIKLLPARLLAQEFGLV